MLPSPTGRGAGGEGLSLYLDPSSAVSPVKKSTAMRTHLTRQEFFSRGSAPLVWRNLFFPAEILNALGVRMLTLETYAALHARNAKRLQKMFDRGGAEGIFGGNVLFPPRLGR